MKYHLFAGPDYYAGGGMSDYEGAYRTISEAQQAFKRLPVEGAEWGHIARYDPEGLTPILCFYDRKKGWIDWWVFWKAE